MDFRLFQWFAEKWDRKACVINIMLFHVSAPLFHPNPINRKSPPQLKWAGFTLHITAGNWSVVAHNPPAPA